MLSGLSLEDTLRHWLTARAARHPIGSFPTRAQEDIAKSLLHMISNNIGQLAFLYAQLHQLKRIYFGGYFIRNHPYTMHAISFAIRFWSRGEISALFLRHEGYLGAVGAFVKVRTHSALHRVACCWRQGSPMLKHQRLPLLSRMTTLTRNTLLDPSVLARRDEVCDQSEMRLRHACPPACSFIRISHRVSIVGGSSGSTVGTRTLRRRATRS
jgi:hypothetical protein